MTDLRAVADRIEIAALCAEYSDAGMVSDYDRFASLFAEDAVLRWPHLPADFVGRAEIRTTIERLRGKWEFFVQNTHPGVVQLDGPNKTTISSSDLSGPFATSLGPRPDGELGVSDLLVIPMTSGI